MSLTLALSIHNKQQILLSYRTLWCSCQWLSVPLSGLMRRPQVSFSYMSIERLVRCEAPAQFRFIRAACLDNLKGSLGLMLVKVTVMRITIPLDLSTKPFIPLPRFIRTRVSTPLLTPSLVLIPPSSV